MLWIQPLYYSIDDIVYYIEEDQTYTVYDDKEGVCRQIEGADLLEEAKRELVPGGTEKLANIARDGDSDNVIFMENICTNDQKHPLAPVPDMPMVSFNLSTGKKKQNGKLDIEMELFQQGNQGGIRIGGQYCIDWTNRVQNSRFHCEFCGVYRLSRWYDYVELTFWNIHMDQNCLRGDIRLSVPEKDRNADYDYYLSEGIGPGVYYPFVLNLETGVIDLGGWWGRAQLLPAEAVMRSVLLGVPIRKKHIIKKGSILSNDFSCKVVYEGLSYQSAEAAYQSAKTSDREARKAFCNVSPGEARKMGFALECEAGVSRKSYWEMVEIMGEVLYDKFTRNEVCRDALLQTRNRQLIADAAMFDDWDDDWGVINDGGWQAGINLFGRLLTRIRTELSYSD